MAKELNKKKILFELNTKLVELDEIASNDEEILSRFESQFERLSRLVEEASYRLSQDKPIASALKSKQFNDFELKKLSNIKSRTRKRFEKKRKSQSIRREFLSNMRKIEKLHYEEQKYIDDVRKRKDMKDDEGVVVLKEQYMMEDEEEEEVGTIRERVKKMIRFCK